MLRLAESPEDYFCDIIKFGQVCKVHGNTKKVSKEVGNKANTHPKKKSTNPHKNMPYFLFPSPQGRIMLVTPPSHNFLK